MRYPRGLRGLPAKQDVVGSNPTRISNKMKGRETMKVYVLKREEDDYEPYPEIVDIFLDEDAAKTAKKEYENEYKEIMGRVTNYQRARGYEKHRLEKQVEDEKIKPVGRRMRFVERGLQDFAQRHVHTQYPTEYIYDIETWETV